MKGGEKMNKIQKFLTYTTALALFTSASVGMTFAAGNSTTEVYRTTLTPLNNSGVWGTATIRLTDGNYTVKMNAFGLEPNKEHLQHIHGHVDKHNSECPLPTADVDHDGLVSLVEGLPFYGPILQSLTPFQTPTLNGMEHYNNSLSVDTSAPDKDVTPLEKREIVLHGLTVNGSYNVTLPVSCGHLVKVATIHNGDNNGNGNGNGGATSGTDVTISGNGAGSTNTVRVDSTRTESVSQSNNSNVNNNIHSNSSTGRNHSSFNTGGNTFLNTGNATNWVSVMNNMNSNMFGH